MEFTMTVNMDNDAFVDRTEYELGRATREAVGHALAFGSFGSAPGSGYVYDSNGNRVGEWRITA